MFIRNAHEKPIYGLLRLIQMRTHTTHITVGISTQINMKIEQYLNYHLIFSLPKMDVHISVFRRF